MLAGLEERYRRLLIEQFDRLTFRGIARTVRALSLPLEDVYVELKAVADVPDDADVYSADERRLLHDAQRRGMADGELRRQLDSYRVERWREESRRGQGRLLRRSIGDALADPSRPGLVILGDPGSGKTTLLHYLALRAAKQVGNAEAPRLPIFVPLAAYDEWLRRSHEPISLGDYLAVYYDKQRCLPGLAPVFRHALDEGRALVLLDGLDEVLDVSARHNIAFQARALIQAESARGNRFVITSRIVGYREAPLPGDLPHVTVLDFSEAEIASFAHQWCEACEVWLAEGQRTGAALQRAAREEQALLDEVRANPSVLRLAANPLLLTMLALLRRQGGRLPDERIRLYQQYVDMLLDSVWEDVRSDGARTRTVSRFDRNLATSYLIELALWLQRHRPSGTARRQDLEMMLEQIALRVDGLDPVRATEKDRREARAKAEVFLQEMRHFAGLLAERGQDAFGFLHLTFQEYFAGRALAKMEAGERSALLKENLHQPRWREPILLCAGQLGIVEGRTKGASDLGRLILEAGSAHEEMLHRDLFLTAALAADGVGVDRALQDEVAARLKRLVEESRVSAVRRQALRGLARLVRVGHDGARDWFEERVRRKEQPEETAPALAGMLGGETCRGLRHALCDWLDDANWYREARPASDALKSVAAADRETRRRILDKLKSDHAGVRRAAVDALGALVPSDEEVRRQLRGKLSDSHTSVRQAAIGALGAIVTSDEDVRQFMLGKLDDHDNDVRSAVIKALGGLVASDEEVRRLIIGKLNHSGVWVRWAAIEALGAQVAINEEVRRLIISKLADPDGSARQAAIRALGALVTSDEEVRRVIIGRVDDPDGAVRQAAIGTLGVLVAGDEEVRRLVIDRLERQIWPGLTAMIDALGALVASDEEIRRLIIGMLDDPDEGVCGAAIEALGALVTSDEEIRRIILRKLDDPDGSVRGAALDALEALVASDENVRRIILGKLDDSDVWVRGAAVSALGVLITSDEDVRRIILGRLGDSHIWVRNSAFEALAARAAGNEDIRQLIIGKLDDSDEDVRRAAVRALGVLVTSDEGVRRLIIGKLDDAGESVRLEAVRALGALVTSDEDVRRLIIGKIDDSDFDVRCVAVQAAATQIASDNTLQQRLLSWLGVAADFTGDEFGDVEETRRHLADAYAPLLANAPELFAQVRAMLHSPAAPQRQGAAWAIIAMPGGPPPDVLPTLRGLLQDTRAEESWPQRLEAAALLINDRDHEVSKLACRLTMEALDYATQPWYGLYQGDSVRAQAASVLGTLEPAYRSNAVFERLTRLLHEDTGGQPRDAAYQALLRLAVAPEAEPELEAAQTATQQSAIPAAPTCTMTSLPSSLVLHLSDLHFGTLADADVWATQLAEDLTGDLACTRLDAVILSGDLTNRAADDELTAARFFIDKLRGEFHLSPQQIIPVPGNHDLAWPLSKKAYRLVDLTDHTVPLEAGRFIPVADDAVRVRDDAVYPKRFEPFAAFYQDLRGEPYPLAPEDQGLLYHLPDQQILVLGLNSAWQIDHHFWARAGIHPQALGRALDAIRANAAYRDCLKIAVWHHPLHSAFADRITDHGFLELLANAGFRLGLHGHIHRVDNHLYRYDMGPAGRRLEILCAGTFGAPTKDLVPGYPFQYQLLRFGGGALTVETRRREEINGSWKPLACWVTERGKDPAPRYTLAL